MCFGVTSAPKNPCNAEVSRPSLHAPPNWTQEVLPPRIFFHLPSLNQGAMGCSSKTSLVKPRRGSPGKAICQRSPASTRNRYASVTSLGSGIHREQPIASVAFPWTWWWIWKGVGRVISQLLPAALDPSGEYSRSLHLPNKFPAPESAFGGGSGGRLTQN